MTAASSSRRAPSTCASPTTTTKPAPSPASASKAPSPPPPLCSPSTASPSSTTAWRSATRPNPATRPCSRSCRSSGIPRTARPCARFTKELIRLRKQYAAFRNDRVIWLRNSDEAEPRHPHAPGRQRRVRHRHQLLQPPRSPAGSKPFTTANSSPSAFPACPKRPPTASPSSASTASNGASTTASPSRAGACIGHVSPEAEEAAPDLRAAGQALERAAGPGELSANCQLESVIGSGLVHNS